MIEQLGPGNPITPARRGRKPKSLTMSINMNEDTIADDVASMREQQDETPNLFPVKLIRNYHPVHDFLIGGEQPSGEQRIKVFAGAEIEMDREEAKAIIAKGIAIRNDPY